MMLNKTFIILLLFHFSCEFQPEGTENKNQAGDQSTSQKMALVQTVMGYSSTSLKSFCIKGFKRSSLLFMPFMKYLR